MAINFNSAFLLIMEASVSPCLAHANSSSTRSELDKVVQIILW